MRFLGKSNSLDSMAPTSNSQPIIAVEPRPNQLGLARLSQQEGEEAPSSERQDLAGFYGISLERAQEVTKRVLDFRSILPQIPSASSFPTIQAVSNFIDSLSKLLLELRDPFEILELQRYALEAADEIGATTLPTGETTELLNWLDRFSGSTFDETQLKCIPGGLEQHLEALDPTIVFNSRCEYFQVIQESRKTPALEGFLYSSGMPNSLLLETGEQPNPSQIESAKLWLGLAAYLIRCKAKIAEEPNFFNRVIFSFIKPSNSDSKDPDSDKNMRWVWSEPELQEVSRIFMNEAKWDYRQRSKFLGDNDNDSVYLLLFHDGDPHQLNLKQRLLAGDYLPLLPVGYNWYKKLTRDNQILIADVARKAAEEIAPMLFVDPVIANPKCSGFPRDKSGCFNFGRWEPQPSLKIMNRGRIVEILANLKRIFCRDADDGRGRNINEAFLKSANISALILWDLLTENLSGYMHLDNVRSSIKNNTYHVGQNTAIELLRAGFNANDIINLYNQTESPNQADAHGQALLNESRLSLS